MHIIQLARLLQSLLVGQRAVARFCHMIIKLARVGLHHLTCADICCRRHRVFNGLQSREKNVTLDMCQERFPLASMKNTMKMIVSLVLNSNNQSSDLEAYFCLVILFIHVILSVTYYFCLYKPFCFLYIQACYSLHIIKQIFYFFL